MNQGLGYKVDYSQKDKSGLCDFCHRLPEIVESPAVWFSLYAGLCDECYQQLPAIDKKLRVAESILDSAAAEYLDENLASVEAVQEYGSEALGIYLSDEEASKVRTACLAYDDTYSVAWLGD